MQQRARVPMFWPAAWSGDAAIKLLESSPVNCLIAEPEAETQARVAAEAKGIEFLTTHPRICHTDISIQMHRRTP